MSAGGGNGPDKAKEWQMELLMEKLRSKASAFKSLVETAKNLRMAMLVRYNRVCFFFHNSIQALIDIIFLSPLTGQTVRHRQCRKKSATEMFGHAPALYKGYFSAVHGRTIGEPEQATGVNKKAKTSINVQ